MRIKITGFIFFLLSLHGCGSVSPTVVTDDANANFQLREQINMPLALPMALVTNPETGHFFTALKGRGVSIYKRASSGSVFRANVPISQLNNLHAMHLERQGNYLFIALGDFFKSESHAGLAIIDISSPVRPKVTGIWRSEQLLKGSAIVKVQGNYAYLGAMSEGVFVFEISDKKNPRLVSKYRPNVNWPVQNPNSVQHPNARGMDIVNNRLYLCYDAGGIRILDISDKSNLKEVGRYLNGSSNLKQQAYNNIVVSGNYAYAAVDYCGMEVLDISNPGAIRRVSWWNPWKCNTTSNNWFNSDGHTNQLQLDEATGKLYLSSGKSELNVIDVSNPLVPKQVASYGQVSNKKATWGMYKDAEEVYLLYITSVVPFRADWAGIKILSEY